MRLSKQKTANMYLIGVKDLTALSPSRMYDFLAPLPIFIIKEEQVKVLKLLQNIIKKEQEKNNG